MDDGTPILFGEIKGATPLVAIEVLPVEVEVGRPTNALRQLSIFETPPEITRGRVLNVDDICPEVTEDAGAHRHGGHLRTIDDLKTFKCDGQFSIPPSI